MMADPLPHPGVVIGCIAPGLQIVDEFETQYSAKFIEIDLSF
jgi:hypothetical protein